MSSEFIYPAEVVYARRDERAEIQAAVRRVEYAWENLRGWLPNGRGVPNWTREMNAAVRTLEQAARTGEALSATKGTES